MNARPRKSSAHRRLKLPTPDEYAEFVGQIDLLDVWLVEAHVVNRHGPRSPSRAALAITTPSEPSWTGASDGFDVCFPYSVQFEEGSAVHAEIAVTFGLHYQSGQPMSDALFEVFRDVNVPVNTWPFLREFLATSLGRMGWQPFTLPALKQGMPDPDDTEGTKAAPKSKRQAPRRPTAAGS